MVLFLSMFRVLFITRANTVSVYSANTGEWIRDLEETNSTDATIVNIQITPDNRQVLFGCTVHGDIIRWNYRLGTIDTVRKIVFPVKNVTVATFNIIPFDKKEYGFLTWTCEGGRLVQNGMFDLSTGQDRILNLLELELVTLLNGTSKRIFKR